MLKGMAHRKLIPLTPVNSSQWTVTVEASHELHTSFPNWLSI